MAIDLWNEISVERSDKFSIHAHGADVNLISSEIDPDTGATSNLLIKSIKRAFEYCGEPLPPLKATCFNDVPLCSGLGSSVSHLNFSFAHSSSLSTLRVHDNCIFVCALSRQLL
jgi:homoserine kinase